MKEMFENLWWDIRSIFKRSYNSVSAFFTGISNLIKWRKIIFSDRQWDYEYLLVIIQFKLNEMIKAFSLSPYTVHKKTIKQMKICKQCLKILCNDENLFTNYIRMQYRYNRHIDINVDDYSDDEILDDLFNHTTYRLLLPSKTNKPKKELKFITNAPRGVYSDMFQKSMNYEAEMKEQSLEMFCRYFKHVRGWWD